MSVPDNSRDDLPSCGDPDVDCGAALRELELYLDGELPDGDLATIRSHIAACYPCADRATFEEQLRALVRQRCAEHAPPGLVDLIRSQLDQVG